jgi:hypothetical protein
MREDRRFQEPDAPPERRNILRLRNRTSKPTAHIVVPNPPLTPTAIPSVKAAAIAFSAPSNNGGSVILDYKATSSPGGFNTTGVGSPLIVTGLTTGTPYTFTVTARNAVGIGAASVPTNSVTPT